MVYLSHWLFAISPLHNPLPALRWRGEETRGAGLLRALEMAMAFDLRNGLKPIEPTASFSLSINPIDGEGRGGVALIFRKRAICPQSQRGDLFVEIQSPKIIPSPVGAAHTRHPTQAKLRGISAPPLGMHILHMGKHKPKTAPSLTFHTNFTSLKTEKCPGCQHTVQDSKQDRVEFRQLGLWTGPSSGPTTD